MTSTNDELDLARTALSRARDSLARQLDAASAWQALKKLDIEQATTNPTPKARTRYESRREKLLAELDAEIPGWRMLARIDTAIAALTTDGMTAPQPGARAERTRFTSQSRPAPASRQTGRDQPRDPTAAPLKSTESPNREVSEDNQSAGTKRLSTALQAVADGSERLSSIESEVERLVHPEAQKSSHPQAKAEPIGRRGDRPAVDEAAEVPPMGDEAEVEIVFLEPPPKRNTARPITRLADRLDRVTGEPGDDAPSEPTVSLQAHSEEAEVEIITADDEASAEGKTSEQT